MAIISKNNIRPFGKNFTSNHSTVCVGKFEQENKTVKNDLSILVISQICWAIDSSGYIELMWEGSSSEHSTIAYLSGNGKWDLGKSAIIRPENSTGRILLSTSKFVEDDNYTIILQGTLE